MATLFCVQDKSLKNGDIRPTWTDGVRKALERNPEIFRPVGKEAGGSSNRLSTVFEFVECTASEAELARAARKRTPLKAQGLDCRSGVVLDGPTAPSV